MAGIRRLFVVSLAAGCMLFPSAPAHASRKATDMMAEALRQRAAGNFSEAISGLEYALENTTSNVQRNLAAFMLGDCQLEAGRFADAAGTFSGLVESVSNSEERAEALFRLLQAETGLGNKKKARDIFARIRQEHKSSPYYELAGSFVKSEGLRDEVQAVSKPVSAQPESQTTVEPGPVAEPLVVRQKAEDNSIKNAEVSSDSSAETALVAEKKRPVAKPEPEFVEALPASEDDEIAMTPAVPEKTDHAVTIKTAAEKKPAEPARKKTQSGKTGLVKVDSATREILSRILQPDTLAGSARDELVSKILGLQDSLKNGPDKPGMDKVLLDLAEATSRFGEPLEACKTYDQILTHHPASPLVEKAYYEAIRLRAMLGVHDAVTGWSKAFLAAFPASEYRSEIRALVEYSQAKGQLELDIAGDSGQTPSASEKKKTSTAASGNVGNDALLADSGYSSASRKMKDGRYNLALIDFNRLAKKYPDAPQIWWDVALVQVQLEDFKQAKKAINQMLKLDPDNQDANSLAGYINYRLENFAEAASAYDRAGEPEGKGVTFFDAKTASERMKKSAGAR
jgi:tetratricopeptide (TPR) repeat protein